MLYMVKPRITDSEWELYRNEIMDRTKEKFQNRFPKLKDLRSKYYEFGFLEDVRDREWNHVIFYKPLIGGPKPLLKVNIEFVDRENRIFRMISTAKKGKIKKRLRTYLEEAKMSTEYHWDEILINQLEQQQAGLSAP